MDDTQLHLSNPIIPTSYDLTVELVDPTKSNFRATAIIDLVPNQSGLATLPSSFNEFKLHCSDLIILSSILEVKDDTVAQKLTVSYTKERQIATFTLEKSITVSPTSRFKLSIDYIGRIKQVNTFKDKTYGLFKSNFMDTDTANGSSDSYIIATHAQPEFSRRIFPCLDEPAVKTTFALTIRTIERFHCVSCSRIESVQKDNETNSTLKTVSFEKTELIPSSLFGFVVGDLKFVKFETNSNLPIAIYSPMKLQDSSLVMNTIQKYLPRLEEFFGSKFPVNKLDVVLLPFLSDMVMENFGMITAQMDVCLLSKEKLADKQLRDQTLQIIVHELVHQWIGNYISFGSWEDLPFNEAFATWLAYELISADPTSSNDDDENHWLSETYVLNELDNTMLQDADPTQSKSISQRCDPNTFNAKRDRLHNLNTEALFDPVAYHKLLSVLRALQLCLGLETFKKTMDAIFGRSETCREFHEKPIRPKDIFNVMQKQVDVLSLPLDVVGFVDTWVKQPGFPLVSVTVSDTSNTDNNLQVVVTQQRFTNNEIPDQADQTIDSIIYPVPLLIWPHRAEISEEYLVMTGRSLKLNCGDGLPLLNYNSQGYYRVSYESKEFYDEICNRLMRGDVSDLNLFKIFHDISCILGDKRYQKPIHTSGTLQILNCMANLPEDSSSSPPPPLFKSLSEGLCILQTIEQSLAVYPHQQTSNDIKQVAKGLCKRYNIKETLSMCADTDKLNVFSKLLSLTRSTTDTKSLCSSLYKQIRQGPKNSVPIELVSSVYMTMAQNMKSLKEWKGLLELVKSSNGITSHIKVASSTRMTEFEKVTALQNLALTNLGFVRDFKLLNKLLNFITTNFAAPGIENAFIGVSYNSHYKLPCPGGNNISDDTCLVRDVVWKWFKLHYSTLDKFCSGSSKRDEYRERLDKITFTVLQMFGDSPEVIESYEAYFNIKDVWNEVLRSNEVSKVVVTGGSVSL